MFKSLVLALFLATCACAPDAPSSTPADAPGLVCPDGAPSFPEALVGGWSQTDDLGDVTSHVVTLQADGTWFQTTTISGVDHKSQGTWNSPSPSYIVTAGGRVPACTAYGFDATGLALTTMATSDYSAFGTHTFVSVANKVQR